MTARLTQGRLRVRAARALWHAHPARPGPEYRALLRSQWWSPEQLAELQLGHLRRLVDAASSVPFYRERFAGLTGADVETLDDLGRLPVLEREEVERLGLAGLRRPGARGMRASSTGSLGHPVEVLWPLSQMRWLDAEEARARGWFGSEIGEWRLEVRCRPVGLPQAISAVLLNGKALHAPTVADREVARRLADELERRPPTLVWGVSNALYSVALALLESGRTIPARAAWSGGNTLHDHYRRAIEEAFACTVYERYATIETGLVAHECPEGRSLHVPAEGIVAEIVRPDGSPAAPGETGDVLVTSLRNHATPLIRYRIGDRAVAPEPGLCACGRGLPRFGTVVGRATDVLRTRDGRSLGPRAVLAALAPALGSVLDVQVAQDGAGVASARVVQRDVPGAAGDRERLGALLAGLAGAEAPAQVERVDELPVTPGGKIRTIVPST